MEFITLCDAAQSVGGKLYLLGAAWSTLTRPAPTASGPAAGPEPLAPSQFAIAVSVEVDWHEANQPVPIRITLEGPDGAELLVSEGQIIAGKPPIPGPFPLRATLAVSLIFPFPSAGNYRVRARLSDDPSTDRIASFVVMDQPRFRSA